MTHSEWLAEGARLFGPNFADWAFVCPACANVAKVSDFEKFKDKGATPSSAAIECIGRYSGAGAPAPGKKPCNWAAYGLFRLTRSTVTFPDGKESPVFAFADSAA